MPTAKTAARTKAAEIAKAAKEFADAYRRLVTLAEDRQSLISEVAPLVSDNAPETDEAATDDDIVGNVGGVLAAVGSEWGDRVHGPLRDFAEMTDVLVSDLRKLHG